MLEPRCWGASLVKLRHARGTCFPFISQNCPSQPFPACCPSLPAHPCPKPLGRYQDHPLNMWVSTPCWSGRTSGRREGSAAGPLASHCQPLLQRSAPAGLAAWAPGSRIWSGSSNVKAVAQTSRKLKIKGEILYCNWTAPCFTKIWHRSGINKWCYITQLYMLHLPGKPQTARG